MSFDAFWARYPRHIAKQAARRAYDRITRTVSPSAILRALDDHLKFEWKGRYYKYLPYPATWLNATDFSRWEERTETLFDEEDDFIVKMREDKEKCYAEARAELAELERGRG